MLAYGDEAYAMYEKAPANIQVSSPMSYGNLASISNMQEFLKKLLESTTKGQLDVYKRQIHTLQTALVLQNLRNRLITDIRSNGGCHITLINVVAHLISDCNQL